MKPAGRLLTVAVTALLVLYPLLVYVGIQQLGPRILAAILLAAALVRLIAARLTGQGLGNSGWLSLAAAAATGLTLATGSVIGLKFYPVLVSAMMLAVFGYSLWRPPSMIERFARLQQADLPEQAIPYTRKVTWIWCGFFVINGAIATATVFASDQIWALYNGLLSYILIGLLVGGEYLVRLRVQKTTT
ncbi:MAG TPA: hypothetical protein VGR76_08855 [Candidatus Angelobacter sp.]|jgi:uncharacterized membrane protein|nr:hypothetical protein [Candidatus Angelobacter sp.]